MKKLFGLFTLALLLICSCEKERGSGDKTATSVKSITAIAAAPEDAQTRTTLNGLKVEWAVGDMINVHNGLDFAKFTAEEAGPTVSFSGLTKVEGETLSAIYPYDDQNAFEDGAIISMIPANQYLGGSSTPWDPRGVIAVGSCSSEDLIMPFSNAHALVKVVLPSEWKEGFKPTTVTLMGMNGEHLAGYVAVKPSATPSVEVHYNPSPTVACVKESGFEKGEILYISTVPTSVTGLYVFISSPEQSAKITTSSTKVVDFKQNRIRVIDLSNKSIPDLGTPYTIQNNNHGAICLLVTKDGSAVFHFGTNASYHANTWSTVIYDEDLKNDIKPSLTDQDTIEFDLAGDTPSYKVKFKKGTYQGKYFAYSIVKQAFYITSNANDACEFVAYQI